jgi:hypothetical protein
MDVTVRRHSGVRNALHTVLNFRATTGQAARLQIAVDMLEELQNEMGSRALEVSMPKRFSVNWLDTCRGWNLCRWRTRKWRWGTVADHERQPTREQE